MTNDATDILTHLRTVDNERRRRAKTATLGARVVAVKTYQQRRFAHTYADLLASARYGAAARFFQDELYGPTDYTERDAQFARVVPALVRVFPSEIVETVAVLSSLHALSESLDTLLASHLHTMEVDNLSYIAAWQCVGRADLRERQISLTLDVAARLDRLTRSMVVRNSLKLMRVPARAAGLSELQHFLEVGFDSFRAMKGAREFMSLVEARERALVSNLFSASTGNESDESLEQVLRSMPG